MFLLSNFITKLFSTYSQKNYRYSAMPSKSVPQNTVDIQTDKDNFGANNDESVMLKHLSVANDSTDSKV